MLLITGVALAVMRVSYITTIGLDPDANGAYKHYAIDFARIAIHVAAAAAVVWGPVALVAAAVESEAATGELRK